MKPEFVQHELIGVQIADIDKAPLRPLLYIKVVTISTPRNLPRPSRASLRKVSHFRFNLTDKVGPAARRREDNG
jgi:hypothetical protein